jgi:soluble lytic murein transglycosylase
MLNSPAFSSSADDYVEKLMIGGNTVEIIVNMPDEKRILVARELIARKKYPIAYSVVASHHVPPSHKYYAELEWLSGFISCSFLANGSRAAIHFFRMATNATTDRQKSKAAFWLAVAAQKQGLTPDILFWLAVAAQFSSTFYGQISQIYLQRTFFITPGRIKRQPALLLGHISANGAEILAKWVQSLVRESRTAQKLPEPPISADSRTEKDANAVINALPQLMSQVNQYMAQQICEKFFRACNSNLNNKYPILSNFIDGEYLQILYSAVSAKPIMQNFVKILVHAIILNESSFNRNAHSPAGAQGMMQLMPRTAKKEFDKFVKNKLVSMNDPYDVYAALDNVLLGISHLHELIEAFGPNIVLIAAAYNAGIKNVNKWLRIFGDVRSKQISMINWIELIPFKETRLYVQNVVCAFAIYSCLLSSEPAQDCVWALFNH